MMNSRLQNRLTESEILKMFGDVVEAVCWMHTRNPPLMHRDLKVRRKKAGNTRPKAQFFDFCRSKMFFWQGKICTSYVILAPPQHREHAHLRLLQRFKPWKQN